MTKKTTAELLAQMDALMRYAPDLFDDAVQRAADKISKNEVDPVTLKHLLKLENLIDDVNDSDENKPLPPSPSHG